MATNLGQPNLSGGGTNLGNPGSTKPKIWGKIKDWVYGKGRGGDEFSPYAQNGWYPVWKTEGDLTQEIAGNISDKEKELSDPNSKYYTDYFKKLKGTLSAQSSLNSLLGLNRAMGLSMTGSATIANEQRSALEGKITDYAGQSTQSLFQNNLGASNSLLGMGLQNSQFQQGLQFQKQQYEDSQNFDWGSLLKIGGQIAGYALAPATGGTSLMANTALQGGMSFLNKPNPQFNQGGFNNWGYR